MQRLFFSAILVSLLASCASIGLAAKGPEVIDPEEARQDPDFLVQGEYIGEGTWPGAQKTKLGAAVIGILSTQRMSRGRALILSTQTFYGTCFNANLVSKK